MCPTIDVSKSVYERLHELAGPLFSPSDVIERLLIAGFDGSPTTSGSPSPPTDSERTAGRAPRERGAVVKIAGHQITAVSVRDLYEQVLRHLVDTRVMAKIEKSLPYRTSSQRYLVAREAIHPNKKEFVVTVGYKGYFMEAHKNYENAISGLRQISKVAGIPFEYIA